MGRGGQTGDPERALGGPSAWWGTASPPTHSHPAAPGLGAREGANPPPDRPLWAGGYTRREGRIRGGGNVIFFSHPKHGRGPPPAGGGAGFRIGCNQSRLPTEGTRSRRDAGDPSSGSRRGDPSPRPFPGSSLAPKLAPIPRSWKEGISHLWRLPVLNTKTWVWGPAGQGRAPLRPVPGSTAPLP